MCQRVLSPMSQVLQRLSNRFEVRLSRVEPVCNASARIPAATVPPSESSQLARVPSPFLPQLGDFG